MSQSVPACGINPAHLECPGFGCRLEFPNKVKHSLITALPFRALKMSPELPNAHQDRMLQAINAEIKDLAAKVACLDGQLNDRMYYLDFNQNKVAEIEHLNRRIRERMCQMRILEYYKHLFENEDAAAKHHFFETYCECIQRGIREAQLPRTDDHVRVPHRGLNGLGGVRTLRANYLWMMRSIGARHRHPNSEPEGTLEAAQKKLSHLHAEWSLKTSELAAWNLDEIRRNSKLLKAEAAELRYQLKHLDGEKYPKQIQSVYKKYRVLENKHYDEFDKVRITLYSPDSSTATVDTYDLSTYFDAPPTARSLLHTAIFGDTPQKERFDEGAFEAGEMEIGMTPSIRSRLLYSRVSSHA